MLSEVRGQLWNSSDMLPGTSEQTPHSSLLLGLDHRGLLLGCIDNCCLGFDGGHLGCLMTGCAGICVVAALADSFLMSGCMDSCLVAGWVSRLTLH